MRLAVTKLFYSAVASRTIAEHHPDILVMTDPFASLFISHLPIQKLIVTHNPPFGLAYGSSFAARILRDWVYSHVLKRCSAVVAINSRTRALLNEMGYTTEYIPNAINPDNYPAFNDGMPFILAAGRLERVKGLNTLLDAYSRLPGKLRGEFGLRIVGYGPEEKRLRESAARLGIAPTVDFVSWMNHSEFVNTLRQCTVFVLPSVSESMPVTLLEAMACSRPVIASDIHGTSDIVRNEINGLRFLEGSSEMLSTQISRLLESPSLRCRLGTEARTTVVKEFSFVAIAGSYERLFERLVSQSNK